MSKGGNKGGQGWREPVKPAPIAEPAPLPPEVVETAESVVAVAPESPPAVAVAPDRPAHIPADWVRCRAILGSLVRGVFEKPGTEFWIGEEEALRKVGKGEAELI